VDEFTLFIDGDWHESSARYVSGPVRLTTAWGE